MLTVNSVASDHQVLTPDTPKPLSDPGGTRAVLARWVIECRLTLQTATRLGGRAGGPTDMPVLRDRSSGKPLLTGSTLAGALRGCLADQLSEYGQSETADVAKLFGGSRGDDAGSQSPLIVFDSLGELPTGQHIEIRDSVKIDSALGTAEAHKKFDGEVLPAGTVFPVRFELVVPGPSPDPQDKQPPSESQLLALLLAALDGLSAGDISLGARRSRGMGRVAASEWKARRFDLLSADGWTTWLTSDALFPLASHKPANSLQEACEMQSAQARNVTRVDDRRERVCITAKLAFRGGLLVRSPTRQADAPDVMHLQSGGRPVLPGTGVAGVLRQRALRIGRLLAGDTHGEKSGEKVGEFVDKLFGPQLKGTHSPNFTPRASRLRISEHIIAGGEPQRPTRIRIDRFTQGVFESALFDEETHCGGHVEVIFELRRPEPGQLGLLLLLVRDLLTGDLPLGGTTSVGRGVATGTATLQFLLPDEARDSGRSIALDFTNPLPDDDLKLINSEIQQLQQQLLATTHNPTQPTDGRAS